MKNLTISLFLSFILSSCDPGFVVSLSNQSTGERQIQVLLTDPRKFQHLDSTVIIDSPRSYKIPVIKNLNKLSYSFALGSGKEAILQQGIGAPDLSEKIILNNEDTILLSKNKRVNVKKEGMSTSLTIHIE